MELTTPAPVRPRAAGRDWLTIVLVELAGLLALGFVWVLWQVVAPIAHTVVLFLLGAALAFVLAEPSERLARRLGGKRGPAILLIYLLVVVVVLGGLLLLAAPLAQEATRLTGDLPTYRAGVQGHIKDLEGALKARGVQLDLDSLRSQATSAVEGSADQVLGGLIGEAAALGGALMDAVLVLVIAVYLLAGAPALQRNTLQAVPQRYRAVHEFVRSSAARVMGGYLRGQLTMSLVIGVLAGAGTALLGLPYFVVLGVLAALFELVPMFGPILSAVPAIIVALFQPWPTVVWVILFFLVIQQFESNVLGPRVTGHAVGLHPLGALFALLVGIEVAGILGGLFAVPVAGVLWVLTAAAYRNLVASEPVAQLTDAVRPEPAPAVAPVPAPDS